MNAVSACCKASIEKGSKSEYPLGGSTWGMRFKVDVCSCCGEEVEDIEMTCDCCGEVADAFIQTKLGDWCKLCVVEYAEDLMERPERKVVNV